MIQILLDVPAQQFDDWSKAVAGACARTGLDIAISSAPDGSRIDYVVYSPRGPWQDFSLFPKLKAVLSLWAGVERIIGNQTLKVPLARMVDAGLREGMVEYVTGHVLRYHLGIDRHILNTGREWKSSAPPLARERGVGILGLGELGAACGQSLAGLNFKVMGWSRTPKSLPGIDCHSGEEGLTTVLGHAEILVLLMPFTAKTDNLMTAARLAQLPRHACLINPGRGQLVDDKALISSLDSGHLGHATLDVFRQEPLPEDHPFWSHPQITVTPHIAAETRRETAADVIAENIRRGEAGEPLLYLVNREAGY